MASVSSAKLEATWNWQTECYDVTGNIEFMFGATRYKLEISEDVHVPTEYSHVADQVEHIFLDIAQRLARLNNAQMTLEAVEVQPYL